MIQITRTDVEHNVHKAAALLRAQTTSLPITPEILHRVADESDLPIGNPDIGSDLIARTVFIAAFAAEARNELAAGIDAICTRIFGLPASAAA